MKREGISLSIITLSIALWWEEITFTGEVFLETSQFADVGTRTNEGTDGSTSFSDNSDGCASCNVVTSGKGSVTTGSSKISGWFSSVVFVSIGWSHIPQHRNRYIPVASDWEILGKVLWIVFEQNSLCQCLYLHSNIRITSGFYSFVLANSLRT